MSYLKNGDIVTLNYNNNTVFLNSDQDYPTPLYFMPNNEPNPLQFVVIKVNLNQGSGSCNGKNTCGTFSAANLGDPIYYGDLIYLWSYKNYGTNSGFPYETSRSGGAVDWFVGRYIVPVNNAPDLTSNGVQGVYNGFCATDVFSDNASRGLLSILGLSGAGAYPSHNISGCVSANLKTNFQVSYNDSFYLQVVYENCCQNGNLGSNNPQYTWYCMGGNPKGKYVFDSSTGNQSTGSLYCENSGSSFPPSKNGYTFTFQFKNVGSQSKELNYINKDVTVSTSNNWMIATWIVIILLIIAIVIMIFLLKKNTNNYGKNF